ncbi:MAG: HD domain-containing protein [Mariprofundaceae bacterium]
MKFSYQRNEELELIRKETIECLARAAEYKDNETGKHTSRIAAYSEKLAILLGLDSNHVALIREASPMHDIGKIGISESILLKPGVLDENERKQIEKHPEIGVKILGHNSQSKLIKMASTIAISHHEKWNGRGYPAGLIGANIPVEGRIVAICDVFDALISPRPYKKPWPLKKIKNLLGSEMGEHFDSEFAKLFLLHFPDFCKIYDNRKDQQ